MFLLPRQEADGDLHAGPGVPGQNVWDGRDWSVVRTESGLEARSRDLLLVTDVLLAYQAAHFLHFILLDVGPGEAGQRSHCALETPANAVLCLL